ncbi:MAG TPA: hypothetical protein EYP85_03890 [Armatimonadetes bacterium]|nr:hypothetical protein [Armatimonadota bacterium]
MGEYDLTVKHFADRHPADYLALVLGQEPTWFQRLPKELPALEMRVDFAVMVEMEGERFLPHPEFQTRYDAEMPWRMLRYHVGLHAQHR